MTRGAPVSDSVRPCGSDEIIGDRGRAGQRFDETVAWGATPLPFRTRGPLVNIGPSFRIPNLASWVDLILRTEKSPSFNGPRSMTRYGAAPWKC